MTLTSWAEVRGQPVFFTADGTIVECRGPDRGISSLGAPARETGRCDHSLASAEIHPEPTGERAGW